MTPGLPASSLRGWLRAPVVAPLLPDVTTAELGHGRPVPHPEQHPGRGRRAHHDGSLDDGQAALASHHGRSNLWRILTLDKTEPNSEE